MRLLDTHTLKLESFVDEHPPYAILSHCWEDEEVIYSDLLDLPKAKMKKGFSKVEKTCQQAVKDDYDYVWIDTCCIDKSSSAELSEAINSMFAWYRRSGKCYAYLADVSERKDITRSRWFSRAWTLQELLAPSSIQNEGRVGMEFFSCHWEPLGSKSGLSNFIAGVTGIGVEYLEGKSISAASISMRMSWAAERHATRAEDVAYSLLGIFDVNMPLLYGEGKLKAFRRLQEEIMKISEDETLFAWESTEFNIGASSADVLASDPRDFGEARNLISFASDDPVIPYAMTHRGLRIWLQLFRFDDFSEGVSPGLSQSVRPLRSPVMIWSSHDLVWAILRCHVVHDFHHFVIIPLKHLAADIYVRDTSTNVALLPTISITRPIPEKELYIRNSRTQSISNSVQRRFGFLIRNIPEGLQISRTSCPTTAWNPKDKILQGEKNTSNERFWHASLLLTFQSSEKFLPFKYGVCLSLGCISEPGYKEPKPWCHLDDTVRYTNDIDLVSFHNGTCSMEERREVAQYHDAYWTKDNASLRVVINEKKVFGQRMFVVDLDYPGGSNTLDAPEITTREKIDCLKTNSTAVGKSFSPNIDVVGISTPAPEQPTALPPIK
ncbi:uncharacterized protein EKO05_0005039 [Ascochyta rabiei]|uniref:Uncharacterized protein n=1 Tax=Didymella rabiei TaxID=5454 RepID=A0A163BST7_DIDRA|nr:uncharacterized protein EKO05_0005039 [Ascochyta rabiei]KZM21955.1 hypothetical protein ST47_g6858 [Ascochyta rabiei]UPX14561.1 hypothetical protein EKO05_0005039 [Ascochyta rabiei]